MNAPSPTCDFHTLALCVAQFSVDVCLTDAVEPSQLLHRAACCLANQAGPERAAVVMTARRCEDPPHWRPAQVACSDDDVDVRSPYIYTLCNGRDAADDERVSPRSSNNNLDYVSCDDRALLHEAAQCASIGLYNGVRAVRTFDAAYEPHRFIVELAGRSMDWRPTDHDAALVDAAATVTLSALIKHTLGPCRARQDLLDHLTPAQRQVAMLLTDGVSEVEISDILRRSPHTIHDHFKAIFRAWNVHSRAEAISLWRHPLEPTIH